MITAPIAAAPDVETFFNKVSRVPVLPPCRLVDRDDAPEGDIDTLETEAETVPEAFTPDTADKVNWVLGKIADRRARALRIRENAELMAKAEEREADTLEWRFGPHLQAYARKELDGGKKKSVRFYNGVIGFRTRPAGVAVSDPAAALSWAKENCTEAVRESLDKKALAETLLSTGEALPFARLSPAEEVFYIR